MNIIFAGTPVFAACHLQALIDSEHKVVAVYTQPDRPAGRGKKLQASPVKVLAQAHGIAVIQPASLKEPSAQDQLAEFNADIMVVVAYGLLLPKKVLDTPRLGCVNVHGSILPRWRGAAPIQRAIESGDSQSGVTIMQMDVGLDTGDMLQKTFCDILPSDTSADLHDRLAEIGPPALLSTLKNIDSGTHTPEAQDDSQSNYAQKITKSEAEIDWSLSIDVLNKQIRAFRPFPISYTFLNEQRVKVHKAHPIECALIAKTGTIKVIDSALCVRCCDGWLEIDELQLPGKKVTKSKDYLNGLGLNPLPTEFNHS